MFKNTASQKIVVFAFDATTNLPKSGDATNITAYISKDFGSVTVLTDTSATEMEPTNAKGYYTFDVSQTETNADFILVSAKSVTANVVVIGAPAEIFTDPPNFSTFSIDGNGRVDVVKISGTTQTARDLGASVLLSAGTGTGQLDFTSGVVKSNVTQFGGTNATTSGGRPEVNTSHIAGTIQSVPGATGGIALTVSAGTAQAASTTTIRLAAGFVGDPTGMGITISSTAGIENRVVDSYDSVNLDATVTPAFANSPSGTTTYKLWSFGARVITDYADDAEVATIESLIATLQAAVDTVQDTVDLLPSTADVNAQVVDALATDTYAEPGQGAPGATISLAAKINYLFKSWRNAKTQTATTFKLMADDGTTVDQKATVSDDTTTFTRGELISGP